MPLQAFFPVTRKLIQPRVAIRQQIGVGQSFRKENLMEPIWTTPDFEEIALACEINSYALAEL